MSIPLAALVVVVMSAGLAAQGQQNPSPPAQNPAPAAENLLPPVNPAPATQNQAPATQEEQGERSGTISGKVVDRDGNALPGAFVRLRRGDAADRVVSADASGSFTFTNVAPATYALDGFAEGNSIASSRSITVAAGDQLTEFVVAAPRSLFLLMFTLGMLVSYVVVLLLFRYYNVSWPARTLLKAQLDSVEARLQLEVDNQEHRHIERLRTELHKIREHFVPDRVSKGERLFWSRGSEIAGWMRIHEIERQLVAYLVPTARVIERAYTSEAELRISPSTEGRVMSERLRTSLHEISRERERNPGQADPPARLVDQIKQQLGEALAIIYDERDTKFLSMMELHNKAMWMAHVAVVTIMVLAVAFRHEELFLFGAAGGLMSRMARVLLREDVATDYGASWTTLFLSPLVGAISAWFGIAVIVFLTQLNVLGDALAVISWTTHANNPVTITVAVALGFSERLFTSLLRRVDERVEPRTADRSGAVVPAPVAAGAGAGAAVPAEPADAGAAAEAESPAAAAAATGTPDDLIVKALDITRGERAAFIGDPTSSARDPLRAAAGRENVLDLGIEQLKTIKSIDAVLLEILPDTAAIRSAARVIADALAPDGRVVVVSTSPGALYDADAQTQTLANHVGPALLREAMTDAGLLAQEPPEQLDGPEPIRWAAAFAKPA
jgi:hypothetical protein